MVINARSLAHLKRRDIDAYNALSARPPLRAAFAMAEVAGMLLDAATRAHDVGCTESEFLAMAADVFAESGE